MIPKIEKILFTTDFSERSHLSMQWAMALAKLHGAKLLALNVIDDPAALSPSIQMYFTEPEWNNLKKRMETEAVEQTRNRLQSFCDDVKAGAPECEYVDVEITVRRGNPVDKIIDVAKESAADIIVMGTVGGGGLTGAILGSTARRVLRRSPIPVLAVPMAKSEH
jgi:nucleotide-binding universal stress UspA family protein